MFSLTDNRRSCHAAATTDLLLLVQDMQRWQEEGEIENENLKNSFTGDSNNLTPTK